MPETLEKFWTQIVQAEPALYNDLLNKRKLTNVWEAVVKILNCSEKVKRKIQQSENRQRPTDTHTQRVGQVEKDQVELIQQSQWRERKDRKWEGRGQDFQNNTGNNKLETLTVRR